MSIACAMFHVIGSPFWNYESLGNEARHLWSLGMRVGLYRDHNMLMSW